MTDHLAALLAATIYTAYWTQAEYGKIYPLINIDFLLLHLFGEDDSALLSLQGVHCRTLHKSRLPNCSPTAASADITTSAQHCPRVAHAHCRRK